MRDLFADGNNVLQRFRQKGLAARVLGKPLEHQRISVGILLIEDADRVDDRVGLSHHGDDFGQLMLAGVVAAIADDDQHFLVAIAHLQMFERGSNRIVQCCLAIGLEFWTVLLPTELLDR